MYFDPARPVRADGHLIMSARPVFDPDGQPLPEADPEFLQPTTPLKLVGFRLSDAMLGEAELWRFKVWYIARRFPNKYNGSFKSAFSNCLDGLLKL